MATLIYDWIIESDVAIGVKVTGVVADSSINSPFSVVIPEKPGGEWGDCKVLAITDNAFKNTLLESIIIPGSVVSIGNEAFADCRQLALVTIGSGVTSIGTKAFSYCSKLTSITIPGSVKSIGDYAFEWCSILSKAELAEGVESIGNYAFRSCYNNLTEIELPSSVISVGKYAFESCRHLEIARLGNSKITEIATGTFKECDLLAEVHIPDSVTEIGWSAFNKCEKLTTVELSTNTKLTTIDSEAFYWCKSLVNFEIPDSVTSIGGSAFSNCYNLTSVEIGDSVESIGSYAFRSCSSLTSIVIPNSVTSIGDSAFYDCSSLTSVTIGNSVTSISSSAFNSCRSLTNIEIPDSVTSIGDHAFLSCSSLTSVVIPDSVTNIGGSAFFNCNSLESITLPFTGSSKTQGTGYDSVFGYIFGYTTTTGSMGKVEGAIYQISDTTDSTNPIFYHYYIPTSLRSVTVTGGGNLEYAFNNCSFLTSVVLGDEVEGIGTFAFFGCTSLKSVVIRNILGAGSISSDAFAQCYALSNIEIGPDVTGIDIVTFSDCPIRTATIPTSAISIIPKSQLETVTIRGGDTIPKDAFKGCYALTSVEIGDSVTTIGPYAFASCWSLRSIVVPNTVQFINHGAFQDCIELRSISIPFVGQNRKHNKAYFGYIFGDETTGSNSDVPQLLASVRITDASEIPVQAFFQCVYLRSITVDGSSSGNTIIETLAFADCSSLVSVVLNEGVTSIDDLAFAGCPSLVEIILPNSLVSIGEIDPFNTGSSLNYNTVGSLNYLGNKTNPYLYLHSNSNNQIWGTNIQPTCRFIGSSVFINCDKLESIILPKSLTTIGSWAFYGCTGLTELVIPRTVTTVQQRAFIYCDNLTVYCEADGKPTAWSADWAAEGPKEVVWYYIRIKGDCLIEPDDMWRQNGSHWQYDRIFKFTWNIFSGNLTGSSGDEFYGGSYSDPDGRELYIQIGDLPEMAFATGLFENRLYGSNSYGGRAVNNNAQYEAYPYNPYNEFCTRKLERFTFSLVMSDIPDIFRACGFNIDDIIKQRDSYGNLKVKARMVVGGSSVAETSIDYYLELPPEPVEDLTTFKKVSPKDLYCTWTKAKIPNEGTEYENSDIDELNGYWLELFRRSKDEDDFSKIVGLKWNEALKNEGIYEVVRDPEAYNPKFTELPEDRDELLTLLANESISFVSPESPGIQLDNPDITEFSFKPKDLGINPGDEYKIIIYPYNVYSSYWTYDENDNPIMIEPGTLIASQCFEYTGKISKGIVRVKTSGGWTEGQVFVMTSQGWKEADSIYVKTTDGWKESM